VKQAEDRLRAGTHWQDHGLVFPSAVGTPLDASHVRRASRKICITAGIGDNGTPRELRLTFVSIMSEQGTTDRLSSDAALAALCGVSPVEASSGKTVRRRLNRGDDRQANNAVWVIALTRSCIDPATRAQRRTTQGKAPRRSCAASSATSHASCTPRSSPTSTTLNDAR
jgi:Transposase IS116/IS110/IS902 family